MKRSNGPTEKPCPTCDTGRVMTGERWSQHNPKVDGIQVCSECFIHNLYAQHLQTKD